MKRPLSTLCRVVVLLMCACGDSVAAFPPPDNIVVVSDDNYPPYLFRSEGGKLQGIIVDKWALWSKKTGIHVNVAGMPWIGAQEVTREGSADVIEAITYSEARAELYEFSVPYADVDARVFFHRSISGINNDATSMRGFAIGAKHGSACANWLTERGIDTIFGYPTSEDLIKAAGAGEVRLFCMDSPVAAYYLFKLNLAGEFRQTDPLYVARFHWAVAKGRTELRDFIQSGFGNFTTDELREIDARWLGHPLGSALDSRYLYYVAAFGLGLLATAALLVAWNRALQRKVSARTAELRTALESMEDQVLALRESEDRFSRMFRMSPDGIVVTSVGDGRVIEVNDAMLRILGRERNDVIGRTVSDLGIWRDAFEHQAMVAVPAMTPGGIRQYEHTVRTPAGDKRDVLARTTRMDLQGQAVLLSIVRDITERRRAQLLLEESEQRLAKMIEASPEAITIASVDDGTFISVNPAGERLSGYTRDEMIGRSAVAMGFYPDPEERRRLIADLQHNEIVHARELRLRRKDGKVRDVLASAAMIDTGGQRVVLFQGIDITERKNSEKALREHQELLRELSAHHESVREGERAHIAREIHDEMGQALTALKMDLSVIGLESGKKAPRVAAQVQELKQRVDGLIQTVRNVATALRPAALDLGILPGVEWLVDEFQKRNGIPCSVRVENGEVDLPEDRGIVLFRILQESLTNIARHADARNVEILLRRDATHVRLDVKDDGKGFDTDAAGRKKTFGLLGIRERVIMLHGSLSITSVPGEGTQVSVSIPVRSG
jgi:PAS domain S-box-containing protein